MSFFPTATHVMCMGAWRLTISRTNAWFVERRPIFGMPNNSKCATAISLSCRNSHSFHSPSNGFDSPDFYGLPGGNTTRTKKAEYSEVSPPHNPPSFAPTGNPIIKRAKQKMQMNIPAHRALVTQRRSLNASSTVPKIGIKKYHSTDRRPTTTCVSAVKPGSSLVSGGTRLSSVESSRTLAR
jgi:hypothetical protein